MTTERASDLIVLYDGKDTVVGLTPALNLPTGNNPSVHQLILDLLKQKGAKNGEVGLFEINVKRNVVDKDTIGVTVEPYTEYSKMRVYVPAIDWFNRIQEKLNELTGYVFSDEYSMPAIQEMLEKQNGTNHVSFPVTSINDDLAKLLFSINTANGNSAVRLSSIDRVLTKTPNILLDSYLLDSFEQRMRTVPSALMNSDGTLYFLPESIRKFYNFIVAPLNGILNISKTALFGRAGAGKTALSKALASHHNLDYVYVNMAQLQTPSDLYSRRTMRNGELFDELTPLSKALMTKTDKGVVITLDEMNRIQTELTNPLLALLGEQHVLSMGDGSVLEFEGNRPVIFILTGNVGGQYVGTDIIDPAILSRITAIIEMEGISSELIAKIMRDQKISASVSDEVINKIAKIIALVSDAIDENGGNEITTRHAIDVLKMLVCDIGLEDALKIVIVSKQDQSIRANIETIINTNL